MLFLPKGDSLPPFEQLNASDKGILAGHQLTIGAPRRPMMSGRGLRVLRSMMQGQVNVSGARQRARRIIK